MPDKRRNSNHCHIFERGFPLRIVTLGPGGYRKERVVWRSLDDIFSPEPYQDNPEDPEYREFEEHWNALPGLGL